ncbi:PREDICTED: uncharacterized protein LOC108780131 [Cyphomyrmex costatus]|uniref:Uncharacterized protein n=1 Tax=Cyphomyrmex costatus TaxID=456900 RepID=A0A195C4R5_9HYME|nr:PREDICTED: uncharacterized protein LOC108780131 [Cyphomyrmex costatus]KYM95600.1 hypothetical protein ALC62_13715 [Cyphomyrmex costatus]
MPCLSAMFSLIFLLAGVNAAGIGEAWQITPYMKSLYTDYAFRPRLDTSAFEVRTISGIGRLAPLDETRNLQKRPELTTLSFVEPNGLPEEAEEALHENKNLEHLRKLLEDSPYNDSEVKDDVVEGSAVPIQKILRKTLMMKILHADKEDDDDDDEQATRGIVQRIRRQAENVTSMEKISMKNVREARLNSPETWSTAPQPISVEFRQRIPLDQVIQQQQEEEEAAALSSIYRRHQAPRADFVTGQQHRRYPDYRESRDMPVTRNYDDYDPMSWYRNAIRERDYEYRRGYSYQYPDRYRIERDYYVRSPSDQYYDRYDRSRDEDLDLYGRNRPMPKPRRIIYYATLPEIVRKPVDLRNYPRYDGAVRTSITRDSTHKRIPGNVDPGKYRYTQSYGGYDPYTKRSSYYDHSYGYPEDNSRVRVSTKEDLRNDRFEGTNERKVSNLIAIKDNDSSKLPWPVQIGTEVSIKDDERISGRKIFGESNIGYERFQSAQLQKAPDATGSSELQNDN